MSVCLSPHNLHALLRPYLCRHLDRLTLWGRVSWAAFRENLNRCGLNVNIALAQRLAAVSSTSLNTWPWHSRDLACSKLVWFPDPLCKYLAHAFICREGLGTRLAPNALLHPPWWLSLLLLLHMKRPKTTLLKFLWFHSESFRVHVYASGSYYISNWSSIIRQ